MKESLKFVDINVSDLHWTYMPKTEDNKLIDVAEAKLLAHAVAPGTFRPVNILEVGTHRGQTTSNLAQVVKAFGGMVVTVDVDRVSDTLPEFQHNEVLPIDQIGCEIPDDLLPWVTKCIIHPGDLGTLLEGLSHRYDMVFIDGDHSYDGVKSDFEICRGWSNFILLHDVWWDAFPPPVEGPLKLMKELNGTVLNLSHTGALWNDTKEEKRYYI